MTTGKTLQLSGPYDGVVTLNPGIVSAASSQQFTFAANLGTKISLTTPLVSQTGNTYTGATATATGNGAFGIGSGVPGSGSATIQVQWFIGPVQSDTSTIDMSVQTTGLQGNIVAFTVRGGQLDGATGTGQITAATPSGSTPATTVHYQGTVDFFK